MLDKISALFNWTKASFFEEMVIGPNREKKKRGEQMKECQLLLAEKVIRHTAIFTVETEKALNSFNYPNG